MLAYVLRRVYQGIIVIFGVTIITFWLPAFFKGDPAYAIIGKNATPLAIARFNQAFGFNKPLYIQYLTYIGHLFQGNLGISISKGPTLFDKVSTLIGSAVWRTVWLALTSLILSILIAVPLGLAQAIRRNSVMDYAATGLVFTVYSTPTFLLGILLVEWFAVSFHIFPGGVSYNAQLVGGVFGPLLVIFEHPMQFVLPVGALVGLTIGGFSRFMRGSVLDALVQDYVRTARAKGATSRRILYRHTLRNAIIPVITLLGLALPGLFGGALIIEEIFNYPGMGLLVVNATFNQDINVVMGATLVIAVATIAGNLLSDVTLSLVDPRVRLSGTRK
jgi:peptide/nickel transport system permease protein